MHKQLWKDYFSFTRKERRAVIVLILLIVVIFLLPRLVPPERSPADEKVVLESIPRELSQFKTDSVGDRAGDADHLAYESGQDAVRKPELFHFDPNTLSAAGWKKLGLRDKTVGTILRYLSRGGRFRQKEDIAKIYGLRPEEVQRLLPYVRLPDTPMLPGKQYSEGSNFRRDPAFNPKPSSYEAFDLNTADTTALIDLPGIGSKLATRIIHFRERLGGFHELDQLKEVYGLPDSTFQNIKNRLYVSPGAVQKININAAGAEVLKLHPYIRWNIANAIVQYRVQHGNFNSVEDIQAIGIITPDLQKKLLPYLTVN